MGVSVRSRRSTGGSAWGYSDEDSELTVGRERDELHERLGLKADIVLIYPIEQSAKDNKAAERNEMRASALCQLEAAGLTVKRHLNRSENRMIVKISATLDRLEERAERLRLYMCLKEDPAMEDNGSMSDLRCGKCTGTTPNYAPFTIHNRNRFEIAHKGNRLFSPLERQRLIFSIIEGPQVRVRVRVKVSEGEGEGGAWTSASALSTGADAGVGAGVGAGADAGAGVGKAWAWAWAWAWA